MPIKGISEVRRLPRLGKIRLGVKETSQKSGNPYPKAVDYFVCNADQSTSEAAARAFREVYGDKPKSLDIMFPTDDRDQFFAQFYRRYGSGAGLLCKGDGETAVEIDRETGEIREIECNPMECEWAVKKHCRPVGTLQFLLPMVPGLGAWQIDTSSYHSIVNLNSAIEFVRALTGGRIAMIPLKLVIRPQEVQVEGKKKIVYVLDLAHESVKLQDVLAASKKSAAQLLLPGINFDEAPDDLFPPEVLEEPQVPQGSQQKVLRVRKSISVFRDSGVGAGEAPETPAAEEAAAPAVIPVQQDVSPVGAGLAEPAKTKASSRKKDPLIHMVPQPQEEPQEANEARLPQEPQEPQVQRGSELAPENTFKLLGYNTGRSGIGTPFAKIACELPDGTTTVLLAKGEEGLAMVAGLQKGCRFKAELADENGFKVITSLQKVS